LSQRRYSRITCLSDRIVGKEDGDHHKELWRPFFRLHSGVARFIDENEHAPDYTIPKNRRCAGDGSIQTLPSARFSTAMSASAPAVVAAYLLTKRLN
jgi:hypothetical protein